LGLDLGLGLDSVLGLGWCLGLRASPTMVDVGKGGIGKGVKLVATLVVVRQPRSPSPPRQKRS
jgi:hypothetical protein